MKSFESFYMINEGYGWDTFLGSLTVDITSDIIRFKQIDEKTYKTGTKYLSQLKNINRSFKVDNKYFGVTKAFKTNDKNSKVIDSSYELKKLYSKVNEICAFYTNTGNGIIGGKGKIYFFILEGKNEPYYFIAIDKAFYNSTKITESDIIKKINGNEDNKKISSSSEIDQKEPEIAKPKNYGYFDITSDDYDDIDKKLMSRDFKKYIDREVIKNSWGSGFEYVIEKEREGVKRSGKVWLLKSSNKDLKIPVMIFDGVKSFHLLYNMGVFLDLELGVGNNKKILHGVEQINWRSESPSEMTND
jgi:hypothetical protein